MMTALRWVERIDFVDDLHRLFCVLDELQDVLRPTRDVVDVLVALRRDEVGIRRQRKPPKKAIVTVAGWSGKLRM